MKQGRMLGKNGVSSIHKYRRTCAALKRMDHHHHHPSWWLLCTVSLYSLSLWCHRLNNSRHTCRPTYNNITKSQISCHWQHISSHTDTHKTLLASVAILTWDFAKNREFHSPYSFANPILLTNAFIAQKKITHIQIRHLFPLRRIIYCTQSIVRSVYQKFLSGDKHFVIKPQPKIMMRIAHDRDKSCAWFKSWMDD